MKRHSRNSRLILGSTSVYRKQLLEKLKIPFEVIRPDCDEDAIKLELEKAQVQKLDWALRLSVAKAESIKESGLIITSDQTVCFGNVILGKPKSFEKAFQQLKKMQGQIHLLITAVTIKNESQQESHVQVDQMHMRPLSDDEIANYLELDKPYDAAGSYKIENSGITLFDQIQCYDFTGIQGLPMIWVTKKLKEHHYEFYKEKT